MCTVVFLSNLYLHKITASVDDVYVHISQYSACTFYSVASKIEVLCTCKNVQDKVIC